MAKRAKQADDPRRRRGEPGRPSARRGPDPAEVAEGYIEVEIEGDVPASPSDTDLLGDPEDMPSGTVQDQLVYQDLEANRVDPARPADPKRRARERSALVARTVPARKERPKRKA